jgi:hypothetical protein
VKVPRKLAGKLPWKLIGLAGVAGVAATGVIIARDQRARADLTPDEIRERLQERLRVADEAETTGD